MSGQTTLGAFTAPQSALPGSCPNTCSTCILQRGFFRIGDKMKVRCKSVGLRDIPRGCGGWTDGSDPAACWPKKPDNFNPAPESAEANPIPCPDCGARLRLRPSKHVHAGRHYCPQCGYSEVGWP